MRLIRFMFASLILYVKFNNMELIFLRWNFSWRQRTVDAKLVHKNRVRSGRKIEWIASSELKNLIDTIHKSIILYMDANE